MYQNLKVEWAENKETRTEPPKPYKKVTVTDEKEAKFDVNIFSDFPDFANIKPGSVLRAKLVQKGQYWNIVSETQGNASGKRPNMDRIMDKKADSIAEAQARKDKSIHAAQDRAAWMYAKNNASLLIANSKDFQEGKFGSERVAEEVLELATQIYNGEPTVPFN